MRNSAYNPAGEEGGRQSAAPQPPPLSYRRTPVHTLRTLPVREDPQLQVLDNWVTAAPGMKNTGAARLRTHGHGAARLAGYVLSLCILQDTGEWFLEMQRAPYDEAWGCRSLLDFTPQMLADIYRAVQVHHPASQNRVHRRGEGRN